MASAWKRRCILLLPLLLLHLLASLCLHTQPADSSSVSPVRDEGVTQRVGGVLMGEFSADQTFRQSQRKLLQVPRTAFPSSPLQVLSGGRPCILLQARRLSLRYERQKQLDLTERAFSPQKAVDVSKSVCSQDKATLVMRFGDVEELRGLSIRLQLSNTFYPSSGQWWFSVESVSLLYNASEEAVFNASEVYAPTSSSYHCSHVSSLQRHRALLLPGNAHARRWAVTFTNFQRTPSSQTTAVLVFSLLLGFCCFNVVLVTTSQIVHSNSPEGGMYAA